MALKDTMGDILGKLKIGKKDNFPELSVPESPSDNPAEQKPLGITESSGFRPLAQKPPIDAPPALGDLPPMPEESTSFTPSLESKGFSAPSQETNFASKAEFEIIKAKLETVNAKLDRIAEMINNMKTSGTEQPRVRRY